MNLWQKRLLIGAVVAVVATLLFPPMSWLDGANAGHAVIFMSKGNTKVNTTLLVAEWAGVAIVVALLYFLFRGDAATAANLPRIVNCDKCGQKLRVPTLDIELLVTCRACNHKFTCPPG